MANGTKLAENGSVRMLLTGFPGAGKTGALASLANAGFKLRVLDFDGNPESLLHFTDKAALPLIDVVALEDPIGMSGQFLDVKGIPTAFVRGVQLLDRWRYEDSDGTPDEKTGKRWIDLGASKDWGPDTIVVVDGLTGLGAAAMARSKAMGNKTLLNVSQPTWGMAIAEQSAFIRRLTAASNRHHVIVISHLKMVGPKEIQQSDDQMTRDLKERAADLVPTRFYPTALGWAMPQQIASEFPIVVNIEVRARGKTMSRRFNVAPRPDMDLKLPVKKIDELGELSPRNGLLTLFKALGALPPQ